MKIRLFTSFLAIMLLAGCAKTSSPNQAQKWGIWSYINPFSKSHSARVAEEKDGALDEDRKQLTKGVDDLLKRGNASNSTNKAVRAAAAISEQNVIVHGVPVRPMRVDPLISEDAKEHDDAWRALNAQFLQQQKDLDYIKGVLERQQSEGLDGEKQKSTAGYSAWAFADGVKSFINAHWFVMIIVGVVLYFVGKSVLAVYNPVLSMGLNQVEGLGVAGLKKVAAETIQGGELFKQKLDTVLADNPAMLEKVKNLFMESHQRAQSTETQQAVKTLTI